MRTMHQYKALPPTYDGKYSKLASPSRNITTCNHRSTIDRCSIITSRRTTMDKTGSRPPVHRQSNNDQGSSSGGGSNSLPTKGHQCQWLSNMEADPSKVLTLLGTRSIGYLTKLLQLSFEEHCFQEAFASWEFEVNRYEREKTACNSIPRDKRSSAAASPAYSIKHKRLQQCQGDHHRVLQDHGFILRGCGNYIQSFDSNTVNQHTTSRSSATGQKQHQAKGYSSSHNNKGKGKEGYPTGRGNQCQQRNPFRGASKGKGKVLSKQQHERQRKVKRKKTHATNLDDKAASC